MFVTGAGVQWLRDGLGIIEKAADTEELAASLDSNDGVYFVPALTGLGSPHWDPYARGTIVGLTRGSTRAHFARAALEAIAYQSVDAVRAQNTALGTPLEELRADGGATANAWLMQFQADMLGVPVVVPEISETTALGAAYLAGVTTELWTRVRPARDVEGGPPLRAEDVRRRAPVAAGRLAPRARALAPLGHKRATSSLRGVSGATRTSRSASARSSGWQDEVFDVVVIGAGSTGGGRGAGRRDARAVDGAGRGARLRRRHVEPVEQADPRRPALPGAGRGRPGARGAARAVAAAQHAVPAPGPARCRSSTR